jgi:peptidoglycan-associated lipoprotein
MGGVHVRRSVLVLFIFLGFVSASCHKAVSAPPLAAAPPPPSQPPAPPTIALSADRTTITAGQTVTLTWQSTNSTTVTLDNAIGTDATSGSRQVTPQTSAAYTATARGAGGTATSSAVRITVNVIPPTAAQPAPTRQPQRDRFPTLADQFQTAMQSIFFDYDKSAIRSSEFPKLEASAQWLAKNTSVRLTIEGNADERGSQEYNIALGDERAAAVKKYLADHGVLESRMGIVSYGEEKPVCHDETENCWQKNRRAQFVMKP